MPSAFIFIHTLHYVIYPSSFLYKLKSFAQILTVCYFLLLALTICISTSLIGGSDLWLGLFIVTHLCGRSSVISCCIVIPLSITLSIRIALWLLIYMLVSLNIIKIVLFLLVIYAQAIRSLVITARTILFLLVHNVILFLLLNNQIVAYKVWACESRVLILTWHCHIWRHFQERTYFIFCACQSRLIIIK